MVERGSLATSRRIGIGGIAIESSTFSPLPSRLEDFQVLRGDALIARYPFMPGWNFRGRADITWLPTFCAGAIPGGPVTADAYAAMKQELLERVRAVLPLDGFLFDVHGAMNVLGMDDAEGDLATAVRALVGPACRISASMDLHGNVTARLVAAVDLFTAYRLAPHDDALETRERACSNLLRCLDDGVRPLRAWARIPVIVPGERTSTLVEPGRSLYASLAESDQQPGVIDASLWVGYVWADEPRSGATVVVTGTDPEAIRREATKIARRYWDTRQDFQFVVPAGSADWCIQQAIDLGERSIVISDSGDNPTAGGVGDVPYVLERLLAHPALASGGSTAIVAGIADAAAVAACFAAGTGERVSAELGGKLDPLHGRPLPVTGVVTTLRRGDRIGGDLAVLQTGGVRTVVTSRRRPFHRVQDLLDLGLDPSDHHVTVVKMGYLVPDIRRVARHAFLALTPGAVNQDIPNLPYMRVPRPVYPLDAEMADPPLDVALFGGS